MTIRKSTSTVMTIRKAQNNTVNTSTLKRFTHSHLLYDYTQTPAHSHSPPHKHTRARTHTRAHTHTHTHTHTHCDTYHTNTHTHTHTHTHTKTHTTHTQQMKKRRQQQALLLVPCFASPPPPTPPPTHDYGNNFRDSGEGIVEEVRFEAGFKRCERCRKSGLYQDRVPHTRRLILERPCTGTFQVNTRDTEQFVRR